MKYDPLSTEEIAALQRYAAKHGRTWKSKLLDAWMGRPPRDDGGTLRNLRNSHGPSWLVGYKLPKQAASSRPGDAAAVYAEETGVDYATALVRCNMD